MNSFSSRVRYSECDPGGTLSLFAMMNYLQDCSTFQSEALGLGIAEMASRQKAWFLAAWDIRIDRMPVFGEHITVSTWPYAFREIYGKRNFLICSEDGTPLVQADSLWFFYDKRNGRPCRAGEEDVARYMEVSGPRLELPPLERKITVPSDGIAADPIRISRNHLDSNCHVNNAQYVEMAKTAMEEREEEIRRDLGLPVPGSKNTVLCRLEVQYKRAACLGDLIHPLICGDPKEAVCLVNLRDEQGKSCAIVKMEFKKK